MLLQQKRNVRNKWEIITFSQQKWQAAHFGTEKGAVFKSLTLYRQAFKIIYSFIQEMKDKAAIIEAARKFAAKGQIDKAIAELERLITDNKDGNICNTIGDLYLKKGAPKEAADYFTKAAQIYREDGFAPKAIALYKKILNLMPSDAETLAALAALYAEKGVTVDAVENLMRAAEIYDRNGAQEKALGLCESALQLSPSDVNIRTKMSELYLKAGFKERAANGYASIASDYLSKDEPDRAHEFYAKALSIDSKNISSLTGSGILAEKSNQMDKALKFLAQAVSFAPDDNGLLQAYANLAVRARKTEDAKKLLLAIIEKKPSDTGARKLLGDIYLSEGRPDKAWRELLPAIEEAVLAQELDEALKMLHNFKELHPLPVRERIVNIYRTKGDCEAITRELKSLAALYEKEGAYKDALHAYKEVLVSDRDNSSIRYKVEDLEKALGLRTPHNKEEIIVEKLPDEKADMRLAGGEDYESHYISGVDYKKRGLQDEAVREFRLASGDPEKALLSLRMIASCYMEKGAYSLAIAEFHKILEKVSRDDERHLDIKYELAGAYMNNNDNNTAFELYSEIQARDPDFKDIRDKIAMLKEQTQQKAGEKEKQKRDRVSYI
ncbi:MAG: hypothetical protein C4560_06235 [Nitrospiraceae bacterium]|nr:MAG: hypothetical protein C4560_06235 [Nitrospiraceae bacterium]